MQTVIAVEDLRKAYQPRTRKAAEVKALDGISFGVPPGEFFGLSGGMVQRLKIGRALMHDPAILFLDEPTTGLDPQSRRAMWDFLHELNSKGQTIFLTTHYMEEADQLCQRIAIIDHGKLLALDSPTALKRSVPGGYLIELQVRSEDGAAQSFAAGLSSFPGVVEVKPEKDRVR